LQLLPAVSALAPNAHAVPVVGAPNVNCVGSVPVTVMLVMFSVAVPLLVIVTSVAAAAFHSISVQPAHAADNSNERQPRISRSLETMTRERSSEGENDGLKPYA
jgi:hypothetical protein